MNYTILIQCPASRYRVIKSACDFIEALYQRGHKVGQLFLYLDGVTLANANAVYPQDEPNPTDKLKQLILKLEIPCSVCIAAAIKRGILDEKESDRYEKSGQSVLPPFELAGLGDLISASQSADRTVTFA